VKWRRKVESADHDKLSAQGNLRRETGKVGGNYYSIQKKKGPKKDEKGGFSAVLNRG